MALSWCLNMSIMNLGGFELKSYFLHLQKVGH